MIQCITIIPIILIINNQRVKLLNMSHRLARREVHAPQKQIVPQTGPYYEQKPNKHESKLPRPILNPTDAIYRHDKTSFRKGSTAFPAPESLFTSQNNYDAGPDFIRVSSALVLGNPKKTNFPFGAWINPFGSERVCVTRVKSPLRCGRCKAYINPYFRFDGSKTSAMCNICGVSTNVSGATTDPVNLNTPEIVTQGVMDFVVSDKIYMKRKIDKIKLIIAIEMGHFMSESNAFNTIIDTIKSSIENTTFEQCIRVGIIYYNSEGTTYLKLNRKSESWREKAPKRYLIKNGMNNLCCPLSDHEMLFDPNEEKQQLIYILDSIQAIADDFYKNSKYASYGASYPSALKSIIQNFDNETGRVMLFAHTTPKSGIFAIRPRNEEDNKFPLKPLGENFIEFGKELKKSKIGVDMYLFSKDSLASHELATVHYLSSLTGGSVHLYSPFHPENHGENLYYNIYGSLSRKYVYDVDFTARVSNGFNISSFGVGDGLHETRDISLGIMDPANSIIVNFEHQQKVDENSSAFIQFAMMFTTGDGERKIRIINYRFGVTNKIQALHEASDYLTVANLVLRQAVSKLPKGDPVKVREDLINKMIGIFGQYLQEAPTRPSSSFVGHANLCPSLAYIHSFINSRVILNYLKTPTDFRISEILKINNYNFLRFSNYFYPKLFSLGMQIYDNQLSPGEMIEGDEDIEQSAVLPKSLPLTGEGLSKEGVYLKWGEDYLLVLVQPGAPEDLLYQIFGTNNWDEIEEGGIPELESSHNIRIQIMLEELRRRTSRGNGIYLPLLVKTPKNKGPYQDLFISVLKEDYVDSKYFTFLDTIHKHAQMRVK